MDQLEEKHYFTTPVYMVRKLEFLDSVRAVSARYLAQRERDLMVMSASFIHEPEVKDFAQYVSQTAWNILASQGFGMVNMATYFMEMWTQEHHHLSSMDTHLHGAGAQISAFYFLDTPKDGCRLMIHDPRAAKVITNLPDANPHMISGASTHIMFTPEPGTLILTNSWVPHSFTRNESQEPTRFVHMTLGVVAVPDAEVEVL